MIITYKWLAVRSCIAARGTRRSIVLFSTAALTVVQSMAKLRYAKESMLRYAREAACESRQVAPCENGDMRERYYARVTLVHKCDT